MKGGIKNKKKNKKNNKKKSQKKTIQIKMSFPYRNIIKRKKDWKFDKNNVGWLGIGIKPDGLWYEINNCFLSYPHCWKGDYMYKIEIDTKCLYSISTFEDLKRFQRKYATIGLLSKEKSDKYYFINWNKVSEKYCGFEVKNFRKIKKQIQESYKYHKYRLVGQYNWFYTLDASSGCIWDLTAVKNVSYVRKISEKEKNTLNDIWEKEQEEIYNVPVNKKIRDKLHKEHLEYEKKNFKKWIK